MASLYITSVQLYVLVQVTCSQLHIFMLQSYLNVDHHMNLSKCLCCVYFPRARVIDVFTCCMLLHVFMFARMQHFVCGTIFLCCLLEVLIGPPNVTLQKACSHVYMHGQFFPHRFASKSQWLLLKNSYIDAQPTVYMVNAHDNNTDIRLVMILQALTFNLVVERQRSL